MALAAAVQSGLLDLDITPRFWQDLGAAPTVEIAPYGKALAPGMDINLDGGVNELDDNTPVQLSLRFNVKTPPMLTFLTEQEVEELAQIEEAVTSNSSSEGASDNSGTDGGDDAAGSDGDQEPPAQKKFFEPGVMRLAVPNLELVAYRLETVPASQGGYRTYCKKTYDEDPSLSAQGFCRATDATLLFDDNDIPNDTPACAEEDLVTLPYDNGGVLSQNPFPNEGSGELLPIYRVRVQLMAHVKVAGMSRDVSAASQLEARLRGEPPPQPQNRLHLKFASANFSRAFVATVEVLENNTNVPDSEISDYIQTLLNGALASDCVGVNELVIPIPDQIDLDTSSPGLLSDLGLGGIDLGSSREERPQVFMDRLHMNLLVLADLLFGSGN